MVLIHPMVYTLIRVRIGQYLFIERGAGKIGKGGPGSFLFFEYQLYLCRCSDTLPFECMAYLSLSVPFFMDYFQCSLSPPVLVS